MAELAPVISEILGHCPEGLASFYTSDQPDADIKKRAHFLDLDAACEYTKMLIGIPVAGRLGLWALNDANDSNPYCYISKGPCAGAVMLFSHDPEPEIRFFSLASFISSISAVADLEDLRPEPDLSFDLDSEIASLLEEDTDDSAFLLATYLPRAGNSARREPGGDDPGENPGDEPRGLPGPALDAAEGNIKRAGREAAEPVEVDAEKGIHGGRMGFRSARTGGWPRGYGIRGRDHHLFG